MFLEVEESNISIFIGDYRLREIEGTNKYEYVPATWKGLMPLRFVRDNNEVIILNEKFTTDLASIPRFLWSIPGFARDDYKKAALVHDYLYYLHDEGRELKGFKESNIILYEALRALGCCKARANMYYYSVQTFGKPIWNRKG